jgi:hypothetical protein
MEADSQRPPAARMSPAQRELDSIRGGQKQPSCQRVLFGTSVGILRGLPPRLPACFPRLKV